MQAELKHPDPGEAVKHSQLHKDTAPIPRCLEIADGCHLFVVHICKRATTTYMQPHADAFTPPAPPIQTLKIHTDIVINSFMGYLLAGAFFSGQWWDHHSPWAHPPRRFIPFSTSTLRCLLLLYLYCNADLKTGWGMGMGAWGMGRGFRSGCGWCWVWPGSHVLPQRMFGIGCGGWGEEGTPAVNMTQTYRLSCRVKCGNPPHPL